MRMQLTDNTIIILGRRTDGTFDGEIMFTATGGVRFNAPYYVEKHEDHNPPRKETS